MGHVGIPWEWEVLLYFRGNGKERGNGLVAMVGNDNTLHFPFPTHSKRIYIVLSTLKTGIREK